MNLKRRVYGEYRLNRVPISVNTAKMDRIGTLMKGTPRKKGNGEFEFEFTL